MSLQNENEEFTIEIFNLLTTSPTAPSNLCNSLIVGRQNSFLVYFLTTQRFILAFDPLLSLFQPVQSMILISNEYFSTICCYRNDLTCFANGKRVIIQNHILQVKEELLVRYEVKTMDIGKIKGEYERKGDHLLVTGTARGFYVQTCEKTENTRVIATIWLEHQIRLVKFSPNYDLLLVCSAKGDIGLWKTCELKDLQPPFWKTNLSSASMTCCEFDLTSTYFCIGIWGADKIHSKYYLFQINESIIQEDLNMKKSFLENFESRNNNNLVHNGILPPPAICTFSDEYLATSEDGGKCIHFWELKTGKFISKYERSGEEIVGMVSIDSSKRGILGELKEFLLVQSANGSVFGICWPTKYKFFPNSPFFQSNSIPLPTHFIDNQFSQAVTVDKYLIVWTIRDYGVGCDTYIFSNTSNELIVKYESSQKLCTDRYHKDARIKMRIRLYQADCINDECKDFCLKFKGFGLDDALVSESLFYPKLDVWRFL